MLHSGPLWLRAYTCACLQARSGLCVIRTRTGLLLRRCQGMEAYITKSAAYIHACKSFLTFSLFFFFFLIPFSFSLSLPSPSLCLSLLSLFLSFLSISHPPFLSLLHFPFSLPSLFLLHSLSLTFSLILPSHSLTTFSYIFSFPLFPLSPSLSIRLPISLPAPR